MLVLNPWRLAVLFLVSGVATRFMLRKYALVPLLRSRSARLLIPLVFGMAVIVPPQAYDQIVEEAAIPPDFVIFISGTIWLWARSSAPALHPAADLEPSLVRRLSLGLYDGARGVLVALPGLTGVAERVAAAMRSGPLLLIVPSVLFAPIASFAAELPFDARAVRRLVQSRLVRHRLPARLPARPRGSILGRDRAPALDRAAAGRDLLVCALSPLRRDSRDIGMPLRTLWRDRLWLLSMALHGRRARLCAALAHGRNRPRAAILPMRFFPITSCTRPRSS